jgi:hypothetical protein
MELASEMIIQAIQLKLRIGSVPITYYPRKGISKLEGLRDAWRHVRFMLLFAPNYLYLLPGCILFLSGITILTKFLFGGVFFLGRPWSTHLAIFSSIEAIIGWEIILLGYSAKVFSSQSRLVFSFSTNWIQKQATLERMLGIGLTFFLVGSAMSLFIVLKWIRQQFGPLEEIDEGLFALTLISVGIQTIFHAFFSTLLQIRLNDDHLS